MNKIISTCVGCGATWDGTARVILHQSPCVSHQNAAMTIKNLSAKDLETLRGVNHIEREFGGFGVVLDATKPSYRMQ